MVLFGIVFYAAAIFKNIGLIKPGYPLAENDAIIGFMMVIAAAIASLCKIDTAQLVNTSTFKSGLSACVCVLGVAWLGDTFVKVLFHQSKALASSMVTAYPFLLAVALPSFASTLLYSQAATTQAVGTSRNLGLLVLHLRIQDPYILSSHPSQLYLHSSYCLHTLHSWGSGTNG